jgi:peptide/nickel transport system ATP-binding protein
MNELEFRDVVVEFDGRVRAVDGVSLAVPSGSIVGLVGESGSGKSTLAKSAVGLAPVSRGSILVGGEEPPRRRRGRQPVQMIFQDPYSSLDPRMTVGQSIAESMIGTVGRSERNAAVASLLEQVRLEPRLAGRHPSDLSGGQRQRVSIARALAAQPRVIIADEITSALDVSVQGAVLNLVRDLQRELGLSMLFITHNLSVVRYVSDITAVMYLGRIVEVGPTEQLINDPQHPYTASLVATAAASATTRAERRVTGGTLALSEVGGLETEPADPRHPPRGCRFHPRCPIGPRVEDGREACLEIDPALVLLDTGQAAACHVTAPQGARGADLRG